MPRSLDRLLSLALGAALVAACHPGTGNAPAPTTASATLRDADGASVVIHASADDYSTDPAGNSGARIACGVITAC